MWNKVLDQKTIHFVITGETIDSHFNMIYGNVKFTVVCIKDNRKLNMSDLKKIMKTIEESPHKRIIVTHGTFTMPDTARFLKANLKRKDQIVILTGSMIPLTGFNPTDAPFNIGYFMAKVTDLPAGVYLCMNGRTFKPDEVVKTLFEGKFSSILGEG
jgi:L-asparaginase